MKWFVMTMQHWVNAGLNMLTFVDLSMAGQGIQLNLAAVKEASKAKGGASPGRKSP